VPQSQSIKQMCLYLHFELAVVLYGSPCSRQTVPESWASDCEWSVTEPCPCPRYRL